MLGFHSLNFRKNLFLEVNLPHLFFSPETQFEFRSSRLLLIGKIYGLIDTEIQFQPEDPTTSIDLLFEKYGEDFVTKINGNHLFWYQPQNSDHIFLVNNRHESGKLFFAKNGNAFFFSTSLRELQNLTGGESNPEFGSIRSFLANGFTISEKTQVKGIEKIQPGDYFQYSSERNEFIRKSYWKRAHNSKRTPFANLELKLDEYEKLYQQGIRDFLVTNPQSAIGCLLSGGHDTSFLVAQTRKVFSGPLHTFTVVFPEWKFDEGPIAQKVAEKFGCIHHPISFGPSDLDELITMIYHIQEPVLGSSLSLHCLAKKARQHVSVIFGGDGGDTIWGEYYPVEEYHRYAKNLPYPIRLALHQTAKALRDCFDWERFWELEHVASLFSSKNYLPDFLRKLCTYRHFHQDFQKEILKEEIFRIPYSTAHNEIVFEKDRFGENLIEGKLLNGFYTYQGHHTIKLCEANQIEFFMPTIQPKVLAFVSSLPMEWINGGNSFQRLTNNKRINRLFHKKALQRHFEKNEIYNRSFDMPWFQILKPRQALLVALKESLFKRGWYQTEAITKLFAAFQDQRVKEHEILELKNHGYRLISLLSLEVWCRLFLDQIPYRVDLSLEELLSQPVSKN